VLNYIASKYSVPIENKLPLIDLESYNKFNKSKLVIKNQCASHPPIEERVSFFQKLNYPSIAESGDEAVNILNNNESFQKNLTEIIFLNMGTPDPPKLSLSIKEFTEDYKRIKDPLYFDPIFNHYYDYKIPSLFILKDICGRNKDGNVSLSNLFSENIVRKVFDLNNLSEDIEIIKRISQGDLVVKSFDYDGKKYSLEDVGKLIDRLSDEMNSLKQTIKLNDINIYEFFLEISKKKNQSKAFKKMYLDYFDFYKKYIQKRNVYYEMIEATSFLSKSNKKQQIEDNMEILASKEKQFRRCLKKLLNDKYYLNQLTDDIKENLDNYISKKWIYYDNIDYDKDALDVLYFAIESYAACLGDSVFVILKKLLDFKINLLKI
jgi:t-SNARE complex subunit (syntaxin)